MAQGASADRAPAPLRFLWQITAEGRFSLAPANSPA